MREEYNYNKVNEQTDDLGRKKPYGIKFIS